MSQPVVATPREPRIAHAPRSVVIGRHSAVWCRVQALLAADASRFTSIGHRDVGRFAFQPQDRVWVLSFSRTSLENATLLRHVASSDVAEIIYVSSSSTIVADMSSCYEYPRVKHEAERVALSLPRARVLTIGLMHDDAAELPGGSNVATSYGDLARFMAAPDWPLADGRRKRLFGFVERPFRNGLERRAFRCYGLLMSAAGRLPCLLRPADLLLRALGVRWYGYTYLSNKRWISTIS